MSKPLGPYKRALKEAEERANAVRVEKDGMVFHEYPDYETYRDVQVAGNKAKLRMQFVKESHIEKLSDYLQNTRGTVEFGLCHGTRRGLEQNAQVGHVVDELDYRNSRDYRSRTVVFERTS